MDSDPMDPIFSETNPESAAPELLVSAVLHLMSNYTVNNSASNAADRGCLGLALIIERHLTTLAMRPNLAPVLRATCQQLSEQWEAIAERTLPKQEKRHAFRRWLIGQKIQPA